MTSQPHQERVIAEERELADRLQKLNTFIDGERFSTIPEDEQGRMLRQAYYMRGYMIVLRDRIIAFV